VREHESECECEVAGNSTASPRCIRAFFTWPKCAGT